MPIARASSFKVGGGGMLRNTDGTIIDLLFTNDKPAYGAGTKPAKGAKKSDFQGVYAKITIAVDGVEKPYDRSLLVGSQEDFAPTEDGRGITGDADAQIPGDLPWGLFYATLVNPTEGGDGFDESVIDDSDPTVADFSAVIGARIKTTWQENEKSTKKHGRRVALKDGKPVLGKDGKPVTYPREELVVAAYYGQTDVDATPSPAAKTAKPTAKTAAKPAGKPAKAPKAPAVDIAALATEKIIEALEGAKDKTMSKLRLGSKLAVSLQDVDADVRNEVRQWAHDNDNLAAIDGLTFDAASSTLTLDEQE